MVYYFVLFVSDLTFVRRGEKCSLCHGGLPDVPGKNVCNLTPSQT